MDTPQNTGALVKVARICLPGCHAVSAHATRHAWEQPLDFAEVDPFALVLLGGLVAGILWIWLLGKYYPGNGLEQLGLKSAREITENREALEAEDLQQMLDAHNERRRRRGESEVTVADLEQRVLEENREQQRRREAYLADRELDQLLEVTNARRRARGLPERSREDARREFGGRPPADQD
jgi:hypothetical protein